LYAGTPINEVEMDLYCSDDFQLLTSNQYGHGFGWTNTLACFTTVHTFMHKEILCLCGSWQAVTNYYSKKAYQIVYGTAERFWT